MNHVVLQNYFGTVRHFALAGVLLLLMLLTACLGGGDEASQNTAVSPEIAFPQAGSLVCSSSCLSQGQCGTTLDGRTVILAHSSQANTRDHDTLLLNESAVTLIGAEPHTVADAAGNRSTLTFYMVHSAEGGPTSWVTGSCVNIQQ